MPAIRRQQQQQEQSKSSTTTTTLSKPTATKHQEKPIVGKETQTLHPPPPMPPFLLREDALVSLVSPATLKNNNNNNNKLQQQQQQQQQQPQQQQQRPNNRHGNSPNNTTPPTSSSSSPPPLPGSNQNNMDDHDKEDAPLPSPQQQQQAQQRDAPSSSSSSSSLSLSRFVCTTVDGTVYSLGVENGQVVGFFTTGRPLVGTSTEFLIPGLDGRLYTRDGTTTTELPLRVHDLLRHPVRTCPTNHHNNDDDDNDDDDDKNLFGCGIVTGTKVTSLYGLNQDGLLEWTTTTTKPSSSSSSSSAAAAAAVVLQREDYIVEQVSTSTGQQDWNVTLGRFSALDFGETSSAAAAAAASPTTTKNDKEEEEEEEEEEEDKALLDLPSSSSSSAFSSNKAASSSATTRLPSISFDATGTTLSVFGNHDENNNNNHHGVLRWRRRLPSVIAGVYGLHRGQWVPLRVVQEPKFLPSTNNNNDDDDDDSSTALMLTTTTAATTTAPSSSFSPRTDWYLLDQIMRDKTDASALQFYRSPYEDAQQYMYHSNLFARQQLQQQQQQQQQQRRPEELYAMALSTETNVNPACFGNNDDDDDGKKLCPPPSQQQQQQQQQTPEPLMLPSPPLTFAATNNNNNNNNTTAPLGGVFLTWPVVGAIVLGLLGAVMGLFWMYERKKQKWLYEYSTTTTTTTPPLVPSSHPNSHSHDPTTLQLGPTTTTANSVSLPLHYHTTTTNNNNMTTTTTTPAMDTGDKSDAAKRVSLSRSQSLPMFHPKQQQQQQRDVSSSALQTDKLKTPNEMLESDRAVQDAPQEEASMDTTPPQSNSTLAQQQQPPQRQLSLPPTSDIGGIPLIQYSRYRSEFREVSRLGKGGFGTVFGCENVLDGRLYAIKKVSIPSLAVLDSSSMRTHDRLQRVLREVKILALLDHPNIVRYYTAWLEVEPDDGNHNNNNNSESHLNNNNNNNNSFVLSESYYPTKTVMSKCYSSELFLSNPHERPSQMESSMHKKKKAPAAAPKSVNPLGWNNFLNDFSNASFSRGGNQHHDDDDDSSSNMEDYGFTFERSDSTNTNATTTTRGHHFNTTTTTTTTNNNNNNAPGTMASDKDPKLLSSPTRRKPSRVPPATSTKAFPSAAAASSSSSSQLRGQPSLRHTLYIQMQLCSQNSLGDFLLDPVARSRGKQNEPQPEIDIPYALNLFHQVARGVEHVHKQSLIHRDLKPSNCFLDDNGVVKVGDFGLSRESSTNGDSNSAEMDLSLHSLHEEEEQDGILVAREEADNTAGVGTRSYASPEQMEGSIYDASTDVYSLGIMLFELCYPMYTGMERHIVFSRLRGGREFPSDWMRGMAHKFPSLHTMLCRMLSPQPSDRPTSDMVSRHLEHLLSEFTVLSLDRSHSETGATLLRVEAHAKGEGLLQRTLRLLQETEPSLAIVQYGLRSGEKSKTIMEFALSNVQDLNTVLLKLRTHPEICGVRQVSTKL